MGFAAGLAGVGAGFSAVGKYEEGIAQAKNYAYQAQVAINNAAIAGQNATYETQLGEQQVIRRQLQAGEMIGSQRAHAGASGVDPNSGSALRVQEDAAGLAGGDVGVIRNNAARKAYAYTVQGVDYTQQAATDTFAGKNAVHQGALAAMGSLAGGASSVADKWYRWDQSNNPSAAGGDVNI